MLEFLDQTFFQIGEKVFTYMSVLVAIATILALSILYYIMVKKVFVKSDEPNAEQLKNRNKAIRALGLIFTFIVILGLLWSLDLDYVFHETRNFAISISTIVKVALTLQVARLLDLIFSQFLIYNYERSRREQQTGNTSPRQKNFSDRKISRMVTYALYVLAIILILQNFEDYTLFSYGNFRLSLSSIFVVLFIVLIARLSAWVITQLVLFSYFRKSEVDFGAQFAINQIVKYIIYVLAFFIAAEALNLEIRVLLGGLAALLVGVGLGLQQTFNDFFSGIILLFERSVEVGQMVEVDGLIGSVKQIGLRTSVVETRDNITVIVPNSKLITQKVINWSHYDDKVRFFISIGVAYGSDTALVKKLLLEVAKENVYVLDFPAPIIRFISFGESSLDFELHFWSRNFMIIEDVKSDLRFSIDKIFRENKITIPFPQRDVWMRKGEES